MATTQEHESAQAASSLRALTGEEEALYDRQIRLWGVEAQRRLAASNVLLIGDARSALLQEIAKNVLLAGIARLVIRNRRDAAPPDAPAALPAFLAADGDALVASLRDMNPLVDVSLELAAPSEGDDPLTRRNALASFRAVCAIGMPRADELRVAESCRAERVAFLCGRVAGQVGWLFLDAGDEVGYTRKGEACVARHVSYAEVVDAAWGGEVGRGEFGWHVASALLTFEDEMGRMPAVENADGADAEKLVTLYKKMCAEKGGAHCKADVVERAGRGARFALPPVAAILGGMWGREVIKLVSGKDEPLNNFFFFNAASGGGAVEHIGPKK